MVSVKEEFPADRPLEEQLAWLKERVDAMEAHYESRINALAARQERVEQRIAAHERRLEAHERRVAALEARIDAIRRGESVSGVADEDWDAFQTRH